MDNKEQETKALRSDAKKLATVGAGAGVGWAALEWAALDTAVAAGELAADAKTKKQKIAFGAGIVAIGALVYAIHKHMKANELSHAGKPDKNWQASLEAEQNNEGSKQR